MSETAHTGPGKSLLHNLKKQQAKPVSLTGITFTIKTFKMVRMSGGGRRDRTDDLLLAKQSLSQLSYAPFWELYRMVGLDRLELSTSRLSGVRSNHLSYRP